jgi:hypothetical protein
VEPVVAGVVEADGLRGLQQVLDLRLLEVGVAVVDALVEQLAALPDAHPRLVEPQVLRPHRLTLPAPFRSPSHQARENIASSLITTLLSHKRSMVHGPWHLRRRRSGGCGWRGTDAPRLLAAPHPVRRMPCMHTTETITYMHPDDLLPIVLGLVGCN